MRLGALYREDACLVARTWLADTAILRLRGLIGRAALASDGHEGLLLKPCGSVHTFGMRYPIDVVYLDAEGYVLGVREKILPRRMSACRGAQQTLELFAGSIEMLRPRRGDHLVWRPI
ncbi:DUF192 domain-containing protein [Dyella caseinilytica]|uniref:DUF192 domain-containing protein n=1 Tax=Dyella caseinilytica TaxID=1849581 RepID=A0ABX7GV83_9GAMM|nr:DUF192 domain-containing protein [Dyella caseinilytica]QRN54383.1 DUF192 domain-containing protein [Dyella caseinilytica]GFZ93752.1 hypothetical protein GCM10011408_11950 [Dyella caseinilytica]